MQGSSQRRSPHGAWSGFLCLLVACVTLATGGDALASGKGRKHKKGGGKRSKAAKRHPRKGRKRGGRKGTARKTKRRKSKLRKRKHRRRQRHRSEGFPNHGSLVGAARWRNTRYARRIKRSDPPAFYGMPGLVAVIRNATRHVGRRYRRSAPLLIGDLALKHGGKVPGHHSHQSGRDADLGFYYLNKAGKSVFIDHFEPINFKGVGYRRPDLRFDVRRNWALVAHLIRDRRAHVRAIFLSRWLKLKLIAYAKKIHTRKKTIERAQEIMFQPAHADPHNDHFHIRISCVKSQLSFCHNDSRGRKRHLRLCGGGRAPTAP